MAHTVDVPWAVVPLFEPDEEVMENLRNLSAQVPVVAVDDGSGPAFGPLLDAVEALAGVTLLRLRVNRGIAAALNTGMNAAMQRGASLLICFDQDSRPDDCYVTVAQAAVRELSLRERVGALGPADHNPVLDTSRSATNEAFVGRFPIIQSGMVIPVDVFRHVGPFDESLFIDGVDTDFCLRLRREGYWVGVTPTLKMRHRLGAGSANHRRLRLGAFHPIATFHSQERRYYINRNLVHLLRRYGRAEPRWAAWTLRRTIGQNVATLILEDEAWTKLFAIAAGLTDGARGRLGPRDRTVRASKKS